MKASELAGQLNEAIASYGDLEIEVVCSPNYAFVDIGIVSYTHKCVHVCKHADGSSTRTPYGKTVFQIIDAKRLIELEE